MLSRFDDGAHTEILACLRSCPFLSCLICYLCKYLDLVKNTFSPG